MTRYKIAEEIREVLPGQILADGALWWSEDDRIPITMNGDHWSPLGYVENIQREDGIITAEFAFNRRQISEESEAEMMKFYAGTVFLMPVETHTYNGVLFLTNGRLREVYITVDVPWAPGFTSIHSHPMPTGE